MDGEYAWLQADVEEIRAARDLFAKYLRWRVAEVVSPVMWKPGPIHLEHFARSIMNYLKAALIFQDNVLNGEELAKLWQAGYSSSMVTVEEVAKFTGRYRITAAVFFRSLRNRKETQAESTDFIFYYEAGADTLEVEIENIFDVVIEQFPKMSRDQITAPGNFAPAKREGSFGRSKHRAARPVIDLSKRPDEFVRISSKELEAWAHSLRDGSNGAAIHVRTEILAKLANNISHGTSKDQP